MRDCVVCPVQQPTRALFIPTACGAQDLCSSSPTRFISLFSTRLGNGMVLLWYSTHPTCPLLWNSSLLLGVGIFLLPPILIPLISRLVQPGYISSSIQAHMLHAARCRATAWA